MSSVVAGRDPGTNLVVESVSRAALPGERSPLGATPGPAGTNFAIASGVADGMVLCLFDAQGREERLVMTEFDAGVWHAFVPGVGPGQAYGFRALGPYEPRRGLRCDRGKLLLDPYARAVSGGVTFGPELFSDPTEPGLFDSASSVPRSLVVESSFSWSDGDHRPRRYAETVFYEVHVKGFTKTHPAVPEPVRGTYAGLAHDAAIDHLVRLGVTAVELLPVHHSVPEAALAARGLENYWGYNTIAYFAPHAAYSAEVMAGRPGGQVREFKTMVDRLHAAGLEVILDVVFNHTAEGDHNGPTLCHRGVDNPAYYHLDPSDPSRYVDTTGCGNALNAGDPVALQLIMDSLRYWMQEMHVDGFRFDLAATLAREDVAFDGRSDFLNLVAQDPVVSRAKLIAEPWDVGRSDSYAVGRFPPAWSEWNGRYRDSMRDFWRRRDGLIGEFATRFAGSSDLYGETRRRPTASVNLITVHDGFTLRDLVSYDDKHNEANGEGNRDGTDDNRSWNCGAEGSTDSADVLALRSRQSRAMLTTLLLSFGVPLLLGGDEIGRTQHGNNNAYCQDNELSWFDWSTVDTELLAFTRRLIALRREQPVFRRRRFLAGASLGWFTPSGLRMTVENWNDPRARCITIHLDGDADPDRAADGTLEVGDDFLVLVNGWWEPLHFVVPDTGQPRQWLLELDSHDPSRGPGAVASWSGDSVPVGPGSIVVLRSPNLRLEEVSAPLT